MAASLRSSKTGLVELRATCRLDLINTGDKGPEIREAIPYLLPFCQNSYLYVESSPRKKVYYFGLSALVNGVVFYTGDVRTTPFPIVSGQLDFNDISASCLVLINLEDATLS